MAGTTDYTIIKGTEAAVTEQQTSGLPTGDPNDPLLQGTTVYDKICGDTSGVENRGRGSRLEIRDEGNVVLSEPFWLDFIGSVVVAASPGGVGATVTLTSPPTSTNAFIETPLVKDYGLLTDAYHSWLVNSLTGFLSSGTVDFTVKIDGVAVTGLSGTLTSSEAAFTATAVNAVAVGQRVSIDITATSTPVDLEFTLVATRTSA